MRVVIADYYQVVRVGLRVTFGDQGDIQVVGEAGTAQAAVDLVVARQPDVLIFDLNLPDAGGLALARTLLVAAPRTKLLLLTGTNEPSLVRRAVTDGVHGCLSKHSDTADVVHALRQLMAGRSFISVPIAPCSSPEHAPAATPKDGERAGIAPGGGKPLSGRERQVLELFAQGCTLRQIADILGVRAKTVETYRSRLGDKFRVRSRAELIDSARLLGLIAS